MTTEQSTMQPADGDAEMRSSREGIERMPEFIPTPERLSQYLELNIQKTKEMLITVEGREEILKALRQHEEDLKDEYPNLSFETLEHQLQIAGETLHEKKRYLETASEEEKKGIIHSAWDSIKRFGTKHPITMTLLVAALSAATIAAGFYVAGNMEMLLSQLGLDKVFGAAGAPEQLIPPVPDTPPLPGGGALEMPPPVTPPGSPPGTGGIG